MELKPRVRESGQGMEKCHSKGSTMRSPEGHESVQRRLKGPLINLIGWSGERAGCSQTSGDATARPDDVQQPDLIMQQPPADPAQGPRQLSLLSSSKSPAMLPLRTQRTRSTLKPSTSTIAVCCLHVFHDFGLSVPDDSQC